MTFLKADLEGSEHGWNSNNNHIPNDLSISGIQEAFVIELSLEIVPENIPSNDSSKRYLAFSTCQAYQIHPFNPRPPPHVHH